MIFDKVNVAPIFRDHTKTLRDYGTGTTLWGDIFLFYGVPILAGLIAKFAGLKVEHSLIDLLTTSMSVFAALLLNLLIIIVDVARRILENGDYAAESLEGRAMRQLLREIFVNISFCVAVAIVEIVVLIATDMIIAEHSSSNGAAAFVIVTLLTTFLLGLLMVLKRIYVVLGKVFLMRL